MLKFILQRLTNGLFIFIRKNSNWIAWAIVLLNSRPSKNVCLKKQKLQKFLEREKSASNGK